MINATRMDRESCNWVITADIFNDITAYVLNRVLPGLCSQLLDMVVIHVKTTWGRVHMRPLCVNVACMKGAYVSHQR